MHICPKYVNDKTPQPYKEWLKAIDDSLDLEVDADEYENETIKEIFSIIQTTNIWKNIQFCRLLQSFIIFEGIHAKKSASCG